MTNSLILFGITDRNSICAWLLNHPVGRPPAMHQESRTYCGIHFPGLTAAPAATGESVHCAKPVANTRRWSTRQWSTRLAGLRPDSPHLLRQSNQTHQCARREHLQRTQARSLLLQPLSASSHIPPIEISWPGDARLTNLLNCQAWQKTRMYYNSHVEFW